jgi:hypothetical protein
LKLLKESVAKLSVWRYSLTASVHITGSGVQRFENEDFKTAFKNQERLFRDELLRGGFTALEDAVFLACSNQDFQAHEKYAEVTSSFVNFTHEIGAFTLDYQTLAVIKPYVELIELDALKSVLGVVLYDYLKDKQYKTIESVTKKMLLKIIRQALAQYAINMAFEMGMVTVSGNNVYLRQDRNDDNSEQRITPSLDYFDYFMRNRKAHTVRFFLHVNKYLTENAVDLGWTAPALVAPRNSENKIAVKTL